jgi:hypothetical protein
MKIKGFILLIALLAFAYSCKKSEQETINMGYNYFPLETNNYSVYQVDSIVWDDYNSTIDTFNYQVKLLIDSQYYDNENRLSYRWKKFTKTDTTQWAFNTNYSLTITNERLESVQENMRYIKLIFPVIAGSNWDYNSLNIDDAADSQYSDVDYESTILGIKNDSCLTVTYNEEVDLIQEVIYEEKYARNVGLFYSRHTNKRKLTTGLQGYSVVYQLLEYGKE